MSSPPFRANVTFTRRRVLQAGNYSGGRYIGGGTTDTDFTGSVQPPTASQEHDIIKMLPEGERTKKTVVVYCDFATLRTANEADNQEADQVVFLGEVFKVMKINTWAGNILTHDQAFCVRLDND